MKTSVLGPQRVFLFGVAIALMLAQAGPVSAQMNEGTLSGTLAAFGTVNATTTGKERLVLAFDENGLSVTNGPLDHMTWHCSGLADFINGLGQARGFCAGNDPAGDQVVFNWESEEHTPDQKVVGGTFQLDRWHGKIRRDPRCWNVCGLRRNVSATGRRSHRQLSHLRGQLQYCRDALTLEAASSSTTP